PRSRLDSAAIQSQPGSRAAQLSSARCRAPRADSAADPGASACRGTAGGGGSTPDGPVGDAGCDGDAGSAVGSGDPGCGGGTGTCALARAPANSTQTIAARRTETSYTSRAGPGAAAACRVTWIDARGTRLPRWGLARGAPGHAR